MRRAATGEGRLREIRDGASGCRRRRCRGHDRRIGQRLFGPSMALRGFTSMLEQLETHQKCVRTIDMRDAAFLACYRCTFDRGLELHKTRPEKKEVTVGASRCLCCQIQPIPSPDLDPAGTSGRSPRRDVLARDCARDHCVGRGGGDRGGEMLVHG